jgi:hypothetical protein
MTLLLDAQPTMVTSIATMQKKNLFIAVSFLAYRNKQK